MKTALVCIAKNEDNYIDEWIKYHTKLGFDYIYVYQNNWRYNGNKSQYNNVHWIEFDGQIMQLCAYQNFINFHSKEYDWAAFFDVDEYLCLTRYNNVNIFLDTYSMYKAIGINWRFFGNNSLSNVINENYSLIDRFTMAEYTQNQHIKTILHTSITRNENVFFTNPHYVQQSVNSNYTINTKQTAYIHGPFNTDFDPEVQINHYFSKTLEEYLTYKQLRGRADILIHNENDNYTMNKFNYFNKNDIKDLTAYNFYHDII